MLAVSPEKRVAEAARRGCAGTRRSDREDFTLPSEDWEWKTQWRVDHTDADEEGWRYALDFSSSHWGPSDTLKYVRRRKWYRVMRHKQQPAAAGAPELAVDDEKSECVRGRGRARARVSLAQTIASPLRAQRAPKNCGGTSATFCANTTETATAR
jgi:hypothetical protein